MDDVRRGLKEAMRQRTILLVERLRRNIQFLEAAPSDLSDERLDRDQLAWRMKEGAGPS